jgi:hypothetical protein
MQNFHYQGSCPYCISPDYNQIPVLPTDSAVSLELLTWIQHITARLTELEARLAGVDHRRLGDITSEVLR